MRSRNNSAGFTLIELIVALTIIVGILSMVYGSYAATTRSIEVSGARMACVERGCLALRLMARQLRCAYAPPPSAGPSNPSPTGSDPGGTAGNTRSAPYPVAASSEKSASLFQGDSRDPRGRILSFVTTGGSGSVNAPRGLSRVAYRYDPTAATLSICRRDGTEPLRDLQDADSEQPLLHNVTSIVLRFHDGRQWQDMWDFKRKHGLPRAVKVEIIVADQTGRPHHLGTTVSIVQQTNVGQENVKRAAAAW